MVTTARGWWSALEPTLLAFTAAVCGGVSLLAFSHASVSDCRGRFGTTGAVHSTASARDHDSFDAGDDPDGVVDAFVAAPIILTSDDGLGRPLVHTDFGAASSPRPERLALRGPPDRGLPTYKEDDAERNCDSDAIDDDDDRDDDDDYDDDGRDDDGCCIDLGASLRTVTRGPSSILIQSAFDALVSVAPDNHSLRAPPR